ncbi:MAG: AzlD domain-containing protein [Casimicrobiaceae bacterium]
MTEAAIRLWAIIFAVGAANYLVRLSFVALLANKTMPPLLTRALRYVAVAMLTALVLPMVFAAPAAPAVMALWPNAKLSAALIALAVAFFTRSTGWTLVAGMGALWLLQTVTTST